jgi:hypothetical protein
MPVETFSTTTVAPGIAAPEASVTVPPMVDVLVCPGKMLTSKKPRTLNRAAG